MRTRKEPKRLAGKNFALVLFLQRPEIVVLVAGNLDLASSPSQYYVRHF
jgi:hypothetical protein